MPRGRPSRSGKRHPGGKRVQPKQPSVIQPSAWVAAQVKRYGQHYCWALGRAYASGLLGHGEEAKDRLQGAIKFVRLSNLFFGGEFYTCPLDDSPRGGNVVDLTIPEHQEHNRDWLRKASTSMENAGVRPYMEQLVTRAHTDSGPVWLDRMLDVILWNEELPKLNAQLREIGKEPLGRKQYDPRDQSLLKAAIKGLDIVAPPTRQMGIVAQHY